MWTPATLPVPRGAGRVIAMRSRLLLLRASTTPRAARTRRHLAARAPRFGQPDRDRLLAAGHALVGTAAAQRAFLALVHRPLHFLLGLLSILVSHDLSLA